MGADADDVRARLRQRLQESDTPRERLREKLNSLEPSAVESGGVTGPGQYLDESIRSVLDTALRLGDLGITAGARMATGQPLIDSPFAQPDPEGAPERPSFFDYGQRKLPSAEQIEAGAAGVRAAVPGGESPREAYTSERERIEQAREAFPSATRFGGITGEVASLLMGRFPVRGLVRRLETRAAQKNAAAATTFGEDIQRVFTSSPMRRLARGAGRSAETGLEAAVLEVLDGDDPLETAAYAAGGQAIGSLFVHIAKQPKWVASAALAGGALQMLKSATPGGENRILESIESGFDKVVWGIGLGALSAVGGAGRMGRGNTNLADSTRDVLDGLSTIHRGTVLSVLTDWTEGDQETKQEIEEAIQGAANPEYEGRTEKQRDVVSRLRAATPDTGSVSGVIDRGDGGIRQSNSE